MASIHKDKLAVVKQAKEEAHALSEVPTLKLIAELEESDGKEMPKHFPKLPKAEGVGVQYIKYQNKGDLFNLVKMRVSPKERFKAIERGDEGPS